LGKDSDPMKRKMYLIIAIVLALMLALSACATNNQTSLEEQLKEKDEKIATLENEKRELEEKIEELEGNKGDESSEADLLKRALHVIELIGNKDMENLSNYVHPTKGLRFSPYDFIDAKSYVVFTKEEVAKLNENTKVYTWGNYDGTGEPIKLSFNDYYEKFIYDVNFANPHMIGNNTIIGKGNTISNIEEVYPDGNFIEFYFSGIDPKYEGMDWRSLKLVFEQENGVWYLVGIIHSQWTI